MKLIRTFLLVLISVYIVLACTSTDSTCTNCPDDNEDEWQLVADVTGDLKFRVETNELLYTVHDVSDSKFREIKATAFDGVNYHEIYMSYLDKLDGENIYEFDNKNATAIFTSISTEPLVYQYNTKGNITVINASDEHLSASFTFLATQSDAKKKVELKKGLINFRRK